MHKIPRAALLRTVLRLVVIVAVAVAANIGLVWVQAQLGEPATPGARLMLTGILAISLLSYAVLMAIPFVPGVEIGLSLLLMQGAAIAPFVYAATFFGLALAYLVGRFLPFGVLYGLFADIGLRGACDLLETLRPLSRRERLAMLRDQLPRWLGGPLIRYRYLTIALALNIPGNVIIGGGGGIALVAGLSGAFGARAILLTFALAVAPVPLLVGLFGMDAVAWWK